MPTNHFSILRNAPETSNTLSYIANTMTWIWNGAVTIYRTLSRILLPKHFNGKVSSCSFGLAACNYDQCSKKR